MKDFFVRYFKRYGALAAALSFVCVGMFFMAIIPADAVVAAETVDFAQNNVGGVYFEKADSNPVFDMSVPRNAAGEKLRYVGRFKVTHYCACTICTWGTGITASGKPVADGMIAADWSVLPVHTRVYIKHGDSLVTKVVEDKGGAINGNTIDVFVPSHEQALRMGVYYADLYVDPGTALP